jgi:type III secretion protein Q
MNAPEQLMKQIALPRLSANETRARAVVSRQGSQLALTLGARWSVSLAPLPLSEADTPVFSGWLLQAEWAGARFVLRLPVAALTRIVEAAYPPADAAGWQLDALPPELARLALEQAWSQLASALAPLKRGTPRLQSATLDGAALPLPHRFSVALANELTEESLGAELHTDSLGLMLMAGALASQPAEETPLPDTLPLQARLELGRTALASALLRSLRRHDVVLIDTPSLHHDDDGGHRLLLVAGGAAAAQVRVHGHHLEIIAPWKAPTMKLVTETPDDGSAQIDVDAIPVMLSFDLGEISLPLAALRELSAGQTFDLGRPLAGAVRVRANGALVGEGELVEVDGRLGVALTRLGPGIGNTTEAQAAP